jgi:NADH-quinone oxidoreductase E subunit
MADTLRYLLTEEDKQRLRDKAHEFPDRRSAILPGLHIAYDRFGFVNFEMYTQIAEVLNVPVVYVMEAGTFYTMFPKKPVGKYHIRVCDNLSCALRGAHGLVKYLEETHGIKKGVVTPDGMFSLVTEECLAACASAPMMQVNDRYYENLTTAKVDEILAKLKAGTVPMETATSHA